MPRSLLMFLLLAIAACPPARASTMADALAMPIANGLVGASGRARFAWVENRAGIRNLWVADGAATGKAVTAHRDDDGRDLYELALDASGDHLAYVRGGDAEHPETTAPNPAHLPVPPRQEVHLLDIATGADRVLGIGHAPMFDPRGTRVAWVARGALWIASVADGVATAVATFPGTASALGWSPDGTQLVFQNNRDGHAVIALFRIADGTLRYLPAGLGQDVEPVFAPAGDRIAFIRFTTPPPGAPADTGSYWSIHSVMLRDGADRTLWTAPAGRGGHYAGTRGRNLYWAADGALIFPWERSGWIHLHALGPNGGPPRALTAGAFEVEGFTLDAGGHHLLYTANAGDPEGRGVWRRSVAGGPPRLLTRSPGLHMYPVTAGDAVGVIASDVTHPAHAALIDGTGTAIALAPPAPDAIAPAARYVAPRAVHFRAEDGAVVHAHHFRAPGPGRHPALIFVHGGPRRQMLNGFHPSRYYSNAWIFNQTMVAKGYDVLVVNYRGGTGYGLAFRDAPGTGRDGASEYRDVRAAALFLAARPDIDPRRIGLWGGSWGGYLTALGLARDSALFAAGVDLHGVHDLLRAPAPGLSPAEQDAARLLQWQSSPIAAIGRWRSPVLLVHGDDDRNVPVSQSLLLGGMLAARGIPHDEMLLPDERHGFVRHASWVRVYDAAAAFFDRWLMPPPAARPSGTQAGTAPLSMSQR